MNTTQIKDKMNAWYWEEIYPENSGFVIETIKNEFDVSEEQAIKIAYEMFDER